MTDEPRPAREFAQANTEEPYKLWTPDSVFELEPPEYLMDYVLPKRGSVLLYGPTNVGKSILALDWAFRMAAGYSWVGHRVESEGVNVLYVYSEGGHDLQVRYQAWQEGNDMHDTHRIDDNMYFLGLDEEILLRWDASIESQEIIPRGVQRLYKTVELVRPDVVFFDPAQEVWRGMNGNNDVEVQMVKRVVQELSRTYECASIIVHHARKEGDTFRGATTWLDLSDVGFALTEEEKYDDRVIMKLANSKHRYAEKGKTLKLTRRVQMIDRVDKLLGKESVYISGGEPWKTMKSQGGLDILSLLKQSEQSFTSLVRLTEMSDGTVNRALADLEREGLVYKKPGRTGKWCYVDQGDEVEEL